MSKPKKLQEDIAKLQDCGYDLQVENSIRPNDGSETLRHRIAKMCTARVLWSEGFRVDSEVFHQSRGRYADLVGYGCPGRKPLIVEVERDTYDGQQAKYRELYQVPVVKDVYLIDVDELPTDPKAQAEAIRVELGL